MATTAMTQKLVKDIKFDISKLLGRGRKAFPCPIGPVDQTTLWHNMLPPDTVEAYQLLKDREFDTNSMCAWQIKFSTVLESGRYELQFVNRTARDGAMQVFLDPPFNDSSPDTVGTQKDIHFRSHHDMQLAFPGNMQKYEEFIQWIENMAIIERDFAPALVCLDQVLEFCNTIGQLVRAVPDLHKYLPRDRQDLLRDQSRSSNMPYEWGAFDRSRIENLQMSMAKASLMREQTAEWHDIYVTGAHFA